jgi:hypothetical protein
MQDQTARPKPVRQQAKQSNIQTSAPKYPTGPKPYVEVPRMVQRPKTIPASIPAPIPTNARPQ